MIHKIIFILLILSIMLHAGEWQITGRMPNPVYGGQAMVLDSLIYIFGGKDSLERPVNYIQVYNPHDNTWKMVGKMQTARYGFVAVEVSDSLVLYCGGVVSSNSVDVLSLEYWNRFTNTLGPGNIRDYDPYFNRIYFTGHLYKNNLYIFGGYPTPSIVDTLILPYILRYDLESGEIKNLQPELYENNILPYHHMSLKYDNKVYLFGGVHFKLSNTIQVYDLETNELMRLGTMKGLRAGGAALAHNREIIIIGGYNERNMALQQTEIFNISRSSSESGPVMNYGRKELMAVIYQDAVYAFGGTDQRDFTVPWIEKLELVTNLEQRTQQIPGSFALYDNYPNPFNAGTTIRFEVQDQAHYQLTIYATDGTKVYTLLDKPLNNGTYTVQWNGLTSNQQSAASGTYLYRLSNGTEVVTKKMVLLK